MTQITFKGSPLHTVGQLPAVNTKAPDFALTATDLSEVHLNDFAGKNLVLNIFPSLDTPTCANSVRRFNKEMARLKNTAVLCVSKDLPFAQSRFCIAEGVKNVTPVSAFRSASFGEHYGVTIVDGPLMGLLSRAIVIIDGTGKIIYSEQVAELAEEPNYKAALAVLG